MMSTGIKSVRALKLRDARFGGQWFDEILDHWDYSEMKRNRDWREGWISFDCALYRSVEERIYLGITSFNSEIFKAYDRRQDRFLDLGYSRIANEFDGKFHRSLVEGGDGCVYAAVALLHDVDNFLTAPGSPIVKYDPQSGSLTKLGIPEPHVYIQSLIIDRQAEILYGLCFPPEMLVSFNLKTGERRNLGLLGSGIGGMAQGENIVLDDSGCVWSSWSLTRAWQDAPGPDAVRLSKYDPKQQRMTFFKTGLPLPDGRHGTAKPETFFNFHDGSLYASGYQGSLYRIDPATGEATFLFTPTSDRPSRLSSLAKAEEGVAYGVTGRKGQCELMRVYYQQGKFEKIGEIRDTENNTLWQCHDIVMTQDGKLYVLENDNPYRSSFLWEIELG